MEPHTMAEDSSSSNPWLVSSVMHFNYYCCPECIFRSKTVPEFADHATAQHPNGREFFEEQRLLGQLDDMQSLAVERLDSSTLQVEIPEGLPDTIIDGDDQTAFVYGIVQDVELQDSSMPEEQGSPRASQEEAKFLYKCPYCDITAVNAKELNGHLSAVHGKKGRFTCPECQLDIPTRKKLNIHRLEVHKKNRSPHGECGKMPQRSNQTRQKKSFHSSRSGKRFNCDECDYKTASKQFLAKHMRTCHNKERVEHNGDNVNGRCHSSSDSERKSRESRPKRAYLCTVCGEAFKKRSVLKGHMKTVHSEAVTKKHVPIEKASHAFQCETCRVSFSSTMYYVQHYRLVHNCYPPDLKERYDCDRCDHVSATMSGLQIHKRRKHRKNDHVSPRASARKKVPSARKKVPSAS